MTNSGPSTCTTSTNSHPSYAATSSCGSAAECSLSSTLATLSSQHPSYAFANLSSTNKLSTSLADSTSHLSQILNVPSSSPSIVIESSNNLTLPLSPNDHVGVLIISGQTRLARCSSLSLAARLHRIRHRLNRRAPSRPTARRRRTARMRRHTNACTSRIFHFDFVTMISRPCSR